MKRTVTEVVCILIFKAAILSALASEETVFFIPAAENMAYTGKTIIIKYRRLIIKAAGLSNASLLNLFSQVNKTLFLDILP